MLIPILLEVFTKRILRFAYNFPAFTCFPAHNVVVYLACHFPTTSTVASFVPADFNTARSAHKARPPSVALHRQGTFKKKTKPACEALFKRRIASTAHRKRLYWSGFSTKP